MKEFFPEMPFKGKRTYIHGTTMLEYALSIVQEEERHLFRGRLRAAFHRLARTQLTLQLAKSDEPLERPSSLIAEFTISNMRNEKAFLWYLENGQKVCSRIPYPEEKVFEICQIRGSSIALIENSPLSSFETLVSMTKALHMAFFPEIKGWFLCRLDLQHLPLYNTSKGLRVELLKHLGALTRSSITAHEKLLGHIYFSQTKQQG